MKCFMIRILIADDHAVVRKGLHQLIIEQYPSAIIGEVSDGESLIFKVMKEQWDVVICDINMPGRSGLEVLHQIKEFLPKLPVLIMSMYPEDQYALRALKAGASGYLNKDSVHDELIKAIQTVLNGRKYLTPSIAERLAGALNDDINKLPHENLSDREFDVMKMIAAGKSISEIAQQFSLSATTVSTYRARVLEKMAMKTNADLTRYSLEKNLI
jgi:two-component system, NarL family, invasion response regulator UvrY